MIKKNPDRVETLSGFIYLVCFLWSLSGFTEELEELAIR